MERWFQVWTMGWSWEDSPREDVKTWEEGGCALVLSLGWGCWKCCWAVKAMGHEMVKTSFGKKEKGREM